MRNSTLYTNKPKTFRRSSKKILPERNKKNIGWGSNLQNIEKMLRSIYIPDGFDESLTGLCKYWLETGDTSVFTEEQLDKLRVFLQEDQSGAEALIVAYDSEFREFRKLFINGVKPHVYVALKLFLDVWKKKSKEHNLAITNDDIDILNITPIDKLKLNPAWKELDSLIKLSDNWPISERYYYFAKQTCHSANYGIQWATFIMNVLEKSGGKVVIPKAEGIRYLQEYRGLFPEIPESNERIRQQVDRCKIIYNLFGHPYQITNYNITERTYQEYYAWPRQSTVGEITRIAFTNFQAFIEDSKNKWDIMSDCHDSYLAQCPLMDAKNCAKKMSEFMNQKLTSPIDGTIFSMKSECQIGFNWGPYKKGINELGLREVKWL